MFWRIIMTDMISRVRRNHALEHATITVLSKKHDGFSAQGNSTPLGFNLNIYGDITEEQVTAAVTEARDRLRAGENRLALHPNCGTVLLTTATLAALSAQAMFSLERRRQGRPTMSISVLLGALPTAVLAVIVALIVSRPLGMLIQDHFTVESDIRDLYVTNITRTSPSLITRFFQLLLGQANSKHVNAFRVDTAG
jgi:hypothetical protein